MASAVYSAEKKEHFKHGGGIHLNLIRPKWAVYFPVNNKTNVITRHKRKSIFSLPMQEVFVSAAHMGEDKNK